MNGIILLVEYLGMGVGRSMAVRRSKTLPDVNPKECIDPEARSFKPFYKVSMINIPYQLLITAR